VSAPPALQAPDATPGWLVWGEGQPWGGRRRLLWLALVVLVVMLLVMLVWLAGRYEASQVQDRLESDATEAVIDIRAGMTRNLHSLQALQYGESEPDGWSAGTNALLREHREMMRLEWRSANLTVRAATESPFHPQAFELLGRDIALSEVSQACIAARKYGGPAYSKSYFVPQANGRGLEAIDLCMPTTGAGRAGSFLVASYSLQEILNELLSRQLTRNQDVSFVEADGTRLAVRGDGPRGSRIFSTQQVLDLPGSNMILRMSSWRGAPDLFPNVLTALVTTMAIALISVLALLGKDIRRRLRAERDLAEALAFRKAMEDSLVTGLRARDLAGTTTYVNPAFCQMVGFSAAELTQSGPAPYWPTAQIDEYTQRQAIRLAGTAPPREGFESVFMRKDGSLFPVLVIEAPLINAEGRQTGWMSAFLDMSEQRRVEEQSRASQERLAATARLATVGEMASLLSHELNQPLAAIASYATGSANLLQAASQGGGNTAAIQGPLNTAAVVPDAATDLHRELEQAMQRIAEQAERAGKVIKSVNDFVRRRDRSREAVTPQSLLDAVGPLISLQARKLSVRVHTHVEADVQSVHCDRTMIEQVLLNLARNGMQAMDTPGSHERLLVLRVARATVRGQANWLAFSVADLGPGISEAVKRQLFTPFFTTKAEGMGLGLSLCRTVVEQHGGSLEFAPNLPRGTVFVFTLPALAQPAAA
jgi:two-component system, LuxR family, sensor histidine kinase DctS